MSASGSSGRSGRKACGSRDVTGTDVPRIKDQGGDFANARPSQANIGRQCHTTGCSAEAGFSYALTLSQHVNGYPGPAYDGLVLGLFMVLGLGLLGASLLPT